MTAEKPMSQFSLKTAMWVMTGAAVLCGLEALGFLAPLVMLAVYLGMWALSLGLPLLMRRLPGDGRWPWLARVSVGTTFGGAAVPLFFACPFFVYPATAAFFGAEGFDGRFTWRELGTVMWYFAVEWIAYGAFLAATATMLVGVATISVLFAWGISKPGRHATTFFGAACGAIAAGYYGFSSMDSVDLAIAVISGVLVGAFFARYANPTSDLSISKAATDSVSRETSEIPQSQTP